MSSPLAVSALALLTERPMHPYEMCQTLIHRQEDRIVKVRPGSLYHTVGKLERLGQVRSLGTERHGHRPERTTYEITEKGRLALAEWITQTIESPFNEFPAFPVAVSHLSELPRDTVTGLLNRRIRALESQRSELEATMSDLEADSLPRRYWLDIEYLANQCESELAWLRRTATRIDDGEITWAAGPPSRRDPHPSMHRTDSEQET